MGKKNKRRKLKKKFRQMMQQQISRVENAPVAEPETYSPKDMPKVAVREENVSPKKEGSKKDNETKWIKKDVSKSVVIIATFVLVIIAVSFYFQRTGFLPDIVERLESLFNL